MALLDEHSNVIAMPTRTDDSLRMERDPTGMELRLARMMYEVHTGNVWADLLQQPSYSPELVTYPDSDVFWIWIKTARAGIREMRALTFDVVQQIRGKPFYDAKDGDVSLHVPSHKGYGS